MKLALRPFTSFLILLALSTASAGALLKQALQFREGAVSGGDVFIAIVAFLGLVLATSLPMRVVIAAGRAGKKDRLSSRAPEAYH